jgi:hypothetical protein
MPHWDDRLIGAISLAAKRHTVAGTPFHGTEVAGPVNAFLQKNAESGLARTKWDERARNGQKA